MSEKEKSEFSDRLLMAIKQSGHRPSPTEVAKNFNLRFGGQPVTTHAVRKWLIGESIPTQDKVRTLASWLGVQINWLRFGDNFVDIEDQGDKALSYMELSLVTDFRHLDEDDMKIVVELTRSLAARSLTKNVKGV